MLKDQLDHLFHCRQTTSQQTRLANPSDGKKGWPKWRYSTKKSAYFIISRKLHFFTCEMNLMCGEQFRTLKNRTNLQKEWCPKCSHLLWSTCTGLLVFQQRMKDHGSQHFHETGRSFNFLSPRILSTSLSNMNTEPQRQTGTSKSAFPGLLSRSFAYNECIRKHDKWWKKKESKEERRRRNKKYLYTKGY